MVVGGKRNWREQKERRKDQVRHKCKWGMKIQSVTGAVRMEYEKLLWETFQEEIVQGLVTW